MEIFDIIDEIGAIIGQATRSECHNGSLLLHSVVHALIFNSKGGLYLQKRSLTKDIQPGKWDTSVGGHINSGETVVEAIEREAYEELGIIGAEFEKFYAYKMTNDIESEYVNTFISIWNDPVEYNRDEIDDVRIFLPEEIDLYMNKGFFTPNFEQEWKLFKKKRNENTL